MQLLDASLAFALTLAALATVVTIIMEVSFRFFRMRKKNLVKVMKLLNTELGKGSLKMSPEERWEFITKVIENPVHSANLIKKITWQKDDKDGNENLLTSTLTKLGNRGECKEIYNKVTLEHVLRCLAEIEPVKRGCLETSEKIKTELNRIGRKYEEFGSAVSVHLKERAQMWSIFIGVILAIVINVDGIRIFEAYRTDPKLTSTVIEKYDVFMEKNQEVQTRMNEMDALTSKKKAKQEELKAAETNKKSSEVINQLKKELEELETELSQSSEIAAIQKPIKDTINQVFELRSLGVPIGWEYYPNCPYGENDSQWLTSDSQCKKISDKNRTIKWDWAGNSPITYLSNDLPGFIIWLVKVIITGMLIGLGAPFWFDVAKRLAQIRKGLKNPNSSDEDRLAARDANGDAEERTKIVEDVVADAAREAGALSTEQESTQMGSKGLIL